MRSRKMATLKHVTCGIEANLVEVPAAGFVAHVLVHQIRAQLIEADGVGERFAAGKRL